MSRTASIAAWPLISPEVVTWANLVTVVRLVGSLAAFGVALLGGGDAWSYLGLAIYWVGDFLDGMLARGLKQETVFGAELDILADRILVCLFYAIYASAHPEKTIVAMLFLFEFMVLDHWLSNQFVRWPVKSPNYFFRVDRLTWQLLWSRPGKAFNTGLVTLLTIFVRSPWPAGIAAAVLIVVRAFLVVRLLCLSSAQRERARA